MVDLTTNPPNHACKYQGVQLPGFVEFASLACEAVGQFMLLGSLADISSAVAANAGPGKSASAVLRPPELHEWFDNREICMWDEVRFQKVQVLMDAPRNYGHVYLMVDTIEKELVAVKQMPTKWVGTCHCDFMANHPKESEQPWRDFGCNRFLAVAGYNALLKLRGVYRDQKFTYMVSDLATEGDLSSWCDLAKPVSCIEFEPVFRPLAIQICRAVRDLHNLGVIHRDLSPENILLCETNSASRQSSTASLDVKIIDFAMASCLRWDTDRVNGKLPYLAPEVHTASEGVDGFLRDAFAVGVTLFSMIQREYPWKSTQPRKCTSFQLFERQGLQAILRRHSDPSKGRMSERLVSLLEGLLHPDPSKRLTLGERAFGSNRRSVWDEPWIQDGTVADN